MDSREVSADQTGTVEFSYDPTKQHPAEALAAACASPPNRGHPQPPGFKFFDRATDRWVCYCDEAVEGHLDWKGWLFYFNPNSDQWVSYRRANQHDLDVIGRLRADRREAGIPEEVESAIFQRQVREIRQSANLPPDPVGARRVAEFIEKQIVSAPRDGWYRVDGVERPADYTAEAAVRVLLQFTGEDPGRDGLRDTPARVVRALREVTEGYRQDPAKILDKVFEADYDEVVVVRAIPFSSTCEHHLLPFSGTADVGYLPASPGVGASGTKRGGVVGLSKLARLVDCFARRLQVQERMTKEIASAIEAHLEPRGVAVVVRAVHSCTACRGIKKHGVTMITSSMTGVFRDKPEAREEFFSLCRG